MFGKLIRFVLMDKKARERWDAEHARKPAGKVAPKNPSKAVSGKKAPTAHTETAGGATAPPGAAGGADLDVRNAIAEAVAAAEREIVEQTGGEDRAAAPREPAPAPAAPTPGNGQGSPDRQQLIQTALAVHKMKQSALSDLDPEERAQLRALAEKMMGVSDDEDGGKSG